MSNYYVSGCVDVDGEVSRCDDSVAQFWTLYHRDTDGLSEGIIDCVFREDAEAAMRVYEQRDALAENEGYKQAFYEMAEILGIGARPDSPKNVFDLVIKPKLEALMKERGKLASENITLAGLVTIWPQERCPVTEAVTDVQPDDLFPETNSYLNSVRAEGVEMFAKHQNSMVGMPNKSDAALRYAARAAIRFAAQLCAGKDGE
ncbi:hypothetical protein AB9Q52_011000 [Pantoea vagans]|uniref:hypothetical protein n=1 Tax=Pantoea vagans TaxID=470934 RepID=UPI00351428E3